MEKKECPRCKGLGVVWYTDEREICITCNGTGQVEVHVTKNLNKMTKILGYILIAVLVISCGVSEEEIKLREQAIKDSFALIEVNKKRTRDSIELANFRIQDSIQKTEGDSGRWFGLDTSDVFVPVPDESEKKYNHTSRTTYNPEQKETDPLVKQATSERDYPLTYLSVTSDYKVKLFSVSDKINATIYNSARYITYKDISLKIMYYSKTSALLDTKYYTFYEYLKPNSSMTRALQANPPQGTSSYYLGVYNAKVSE